MAHDIQVTDRLTRGASIHEQVVASARRQQFLFRGQMVDLSLIRVPLHLLVYRMANGRTAVRQLSYEQQRSLTGGFFENGEENRSAQVAQHVILLELAKEPTGPIYQELEIRRQQTEPLLVTDTGVVVNGNRRLAAMRDLYDRDPADYASLEYVNALVLPADATVEDLEVIETELQMAPETKLEYGWVEQRLKLRHLRDDRGWDLTRIAGIMRLRRPEEVNAQLQELELAEDYLANFLGKPRAYGEVAYAEEIFRQLQERLRRLNGQDRDVARLIGFNMIKHPDKADRRLYDYREAFGKKARKVAERLIGGLNLGREAVAGDQAGVGADDDDPLAGLEQEEDPAAAALLGVLGDTDRTEESAVRIFQIFEDLRAEERDENVRGAALESAQKAHRFLQQIDLSTSDDDNIKAIRAQLASIAELVTRLQQEIDAMDDA